jgi:lipopolysaccharide transport system ATP-binding protein
MNKYESDLLVPNQEVPTGTLFLEAKDKSESLGVDITYVCFKNEQGDIVEFPSTGRAVNVCIGCKAHKRVENLNLSVAISDTGADNERVLALSNDEPLDCFTVNSGNFEIQLQLPYCGLKPGIYTAKLSLKEGYLNFLDVVESFAFTVKSNEKMNQCSFYQPRKWAIVQSKQLLM